MRLFSVITAVGGVLALAPYEASLLIFAAGGFVAGLVAITWLFVLSRRVEEIQAKQSERINDLPPPED